VLDWCWMFAIILPVVHFTYGEAYWESGNLIEGPVDFLVSYVFPAIAVILFWAWKQATPGKMVVSARIVNARTGEPASVGQLIGRYFAYFLSMIPLGLGFFWIAFDERKQGWHDKLAGTVVVRSRRRGGQIING